MQSCTNFTPINFFILFNWQLPTLYLSPFCICLWISDQNCCYGYINHKEPINIVGQTCNQGIFHEYEYLKVLQLYRCSRVLFHEYEYKYRKIHSSITKWPINISPDWSRALSTNLLLIGSNSSDLIPPVRVCDHWAGLYPLFRSRLLRSEHDPDARRTYSRKCPISPFA